MPNEKGISKIQYNNTLKNVEKGTKTSGENNLM
jgi:hypothetical protein